MIVDARSRPPIPAFLPDRTYQNLGRTLGDVGRRGWRATADMTGKDLDGYLAAVRRTGIERVGIPARVPNRWWGGQGNDLVFEACAQHPDLLYPYAAVDPSAAGAPDEVGALVARGARGIVLEPGICDVPCYVDEPTFDPLYGTCSDIGVPVLLMGGGETGPNLTFSDPVRFERVAIRFPQLQLVNVHGGWPLVQAALGVAYRRPNVWLLPDVYFPGLPGEQDYILAMRTFLRDRFVFATGYPFCPVEDILDRYHGFGLPDDVLAGVLGGNARRLFRLDDPTPGGTSLRA